MDKGASTSLKGITPTPKIAGEMYTKTWILCQSCTQAAAGASGLTLTLGWAQVLRQLFGLLDIVSRRALEEETSWYFTDGHWDVEFGGHTGDAVSHGVRVCALQDRHTGNSVAGRLDFGFESVVELQTHGGARLMLRASSKGMSSNCTGGGGWAIETLLRYSSSSAKSSLIAS
jgi:hypothetical protein